MEDQRNFKAADSLIRRIIRQSPDQDLEELVPVIQLAIDFVEFDSFHELVDALNEASPTDVTKLVRLFREWQVVEAKEMMRVTDGRIRTIGRLEHMIETNALEVPDLHRFLKEFPWVIDPKWTLVDDEVRYSSLLRQRFPDDGLPESDRRIDFLCVRDGTTVTVVEIKRPRSKASKKELEQIEEYVIFMRDHVQKTTDPELKAKDVVGYLLVGDIVDTPQVRGRLENLGKSNIYVRLYADLLDQVRRLHKDFLDRYERLRNKSRAVVEE